MAKKGLFAGVCGLLLLGALAACGDSTATAPAAPAATTAAMSSTTAAMSSTTAAMGGAMAGGGTMMPDMNSTAMAALTAMPGGMQATANAAMTAMPGMQGTAMAGMTAAGTMMPGMQGTANAAMTMMPGMQATLMAGGTMAVGTLDPDVPQYTGATAVALPAFLNSMLGSAVPGGKNVKFAAFTTADSADMVKAFYAGALPKGGWTDKSSGINATLTAMPGGAGTAMPSGTMMAGAMGSFSVSVYSKGTKTAAVLILPSAMAASANLPNVNPNSTLFEIVTSDTAS